MNHSLQPRLGLGWLRELNAERRGALLRLEPADLAEEALIGIVTVRQFGTGAHEPRRLTLHAIRRAFEAAGIEFIDENGGGPGVRLRKRPQRKG